VHLLDIRGRDLQAVEQETGAFPFSQMRRSHWCREEQLFLTEKLRQ
jgi:hypothetical protein